MGIELALGLGGTRAWACKGGGKARGSAFLGEELLGPAQLAAMVSNIHHADEACQLFGRLNGFCAAVWQPDEDSIFAAVDYQRSIPLFYSLHGGCLYLSDSADWIADRVGPAGRDAVSCAEFMLTGYVSNEHTLHPLIKQLRAGELLQAHRTANGWTIDLARHTRRLRHPLAGATLEELLKLQHEAYLHGCERLLRYAGGRRIVLALSGGMDSQRIALALHELGAGNVCAVTYGSPNSPDTLGARRMADCLGMPWHFVEYTPEVWQKYFASNARRDYYHLAHNLASLPHIQDWPAFGELMASGVLQGDEVAVSGMSSEAMVGTVFMKKDWVCFDDSRADPDLVAEAILDVHYRLWPLPPKGSPLRARIMERIYGTWGDLREFSSNAALLDYWGICERQAKFVTNSVRAYEYWGLDWWLPLWDVEIYEHWNSVPIEFRYQRTLSKAYMARAYASFDSAKGPVPGFARPSSLLDRAAAAARVVGRRCLPVKWLYDVLKRRYKYGLHPMSWYSIVPGKVLRATSFKHADINSFLTKELLGQISFDQAAPSPRDHGGQAISRAPL